MPLTLVSRIEAREESRIDSPIPFESRNLIPLGQEEVEVGIEFAKEVAESRISVLRTAEAVACFEEAVMPSSL